MKKLIILFIGAILFPALMYANNDWANYQRYAADNAKVDFKPKAVLMGDSITDGWPGADRDFFTDNKFVGRGISGQVTILRVTAATVDNPVSHRLAEIVHGLSAYLPDTVHQDLSTIALECQDQILRAYQR